MCKRSHRFNFDVNTNALHHERGVDRNGILNETKINQDNELSERKHKMKSRSERIFYSFPVDAAQNDWFRWRQRFSLVKKKTNASDRNVFVAHTCMSASVNSTTSVSFITIICALPFYCSNTTRFMCPNRFYFFAFRSCNGVRSTVFILRRFFRILFLQFFFCVCIAWRRQTWNVRWVDGDVVMRCTVNTLIDRSNRWRFFFFSFSSRSFSSVEHQIEWDIENGDFIFWFFPSIEMEKKVRLSICHGRDVFSADVCFVLHSSILPRLFFSCCSIWLFWHSNWIADG